MRLDVSPPRGPAYQLSVWAVSLVLVLGALSIVVTAWVLALAYLVPVIGFGAFVVVAAVGGGLSFGLGRVIEWLVRWQ